MVIQLAFHMSVLWPVRPGKGALCTLDLTAFRIFPMQFFSHLDHDSSFTLHLVS